MMPLSAAGTSSSTRSSRWHWLALLCLLGGLALLDRGFTGWRNDPLTQQLSDGRWPPMDRATAANEHHRERRRRLLLVSGGTLVLCAVVIFGREPF